MGKTVPFPRPTRRASIALLRVCRHIVDPSCPLPPLPPHGPIPASELLSTASIHGLEGLASRFVDSPEVQKRRIALSARSLLLVSEVLALARLFAEARIPWVSFKGPVLSQRLYGDPFVRDSRDVDLIIPKDHAAEAYDVLVSNGYLTDWSLSRTQLEALSGRILHHNFHHETRQVHVEVHVPAPLPGLTFRRWEDVAGSGFRTVLLSGHPIPVLPPERLLVALAMHGTKHAWERLVWVMDVASVVSRTAELDWDSVRDYAHRVRGWRMTLTSLSLTRRLFGVQVPSAIKEAIAEDTNVGLAERLALQALFGELSRRRVTSLAGASFLLGMDGNSQRVAHFANSAFQPAPLDIQLLPLPPKLFPLYSILRPTRQLLRRLLGIDLAKNYRVVRD